MMSDVRSTGMRNVSFTNWSKTFSCTPELFFAPKTENEIKEILAIARTENKKVRVVGCSHSPSDIACTDGFMISLQNFNRVISVDETKRQITVQAGMTLRELNEIHLPKYNLALSILGSVSDVTVGGAISTGTHGTGVKFGIFSSYVVNLNLLKPDGSVVSCSTQENEEIFSAALCSLGCFGIILTVVLQCEKKFNLIQQQYATELREVIEHLDVHLQASEHFRFMWFPYTDNVVASHVSRTELEVTKKSLLNRICYWILDYAVGYYLLEFCYYVSIYMPTIVPTINRVFFYLVFSKSRKRVDVSYRIFNFECLFKQYVTEWAIDKQRTGEVLWKLKEWIENNTDVYVHFPIEVRFIRADNIYLSPAYGRDTCYVNIIMYRPYGMDVPYKKYWEAYEKIMEDAGGRPHWAKAHKITADKFQLMYPAFNKWCSLRLQIDPMSMFFNSYITRMFRKKIDNVH